ncbi:hypothetical protein [Streptosporangium sp. NPDC004631]
MPNIPESDAKCHPVFTGGRRSPDHAKEHPHRSTTWADTSRTPRPESWATTPEGKKSRKRAYGKTREETPEKWLKLHEMASKGPVPTKHPTLASYLARRPAEVIEPDREPTT